MHFKAHLCGRVASLVACVLISSASIAQQDVRVFEGILNIVWGDPHPGLGAGGSTLYSIELGNGNSMPLRLNGLENVAASYFMKRISVSGRLQAMPASRPGGSSRTALAVDTLTLQPRQKSAAAGTTGTRSVIYLLVKFADDAAVPQLPAFYTALNNQDAPSPDDLFPATVNGFFRKTSWDQFHWIGTVGGAGGIGAPGGWLTLPQPKSYYAPCGFDGSCAGPFLSTLGDDAMALGRAAGIDFKNYDNVNFVLSNDLDCCAWGGGYYSSVDNRSYGATWEPPWGQEAGTYAHEMGHSLGLPHSGWVYAAYDSPWDMMSARTSAQAVACGSYASRNSEAVRDVYCTEPGDGYIGGHKDYLGWIPVANRIQTTNTAPPATVVLEAASLPLGALAKLVNICLDGIPCTGPSAHYFTVEARLGGAGAASQFDNELYGEGIIIHEFQRDRPAVSGDCFSNSQSGWASPIDSTPDDYDSVNCTSGERPFPEFGLYNAQWLPGQTYVNTAHSLAIRVDSRLDSTFTVSIFSTVPGPPVIGAATAGNASISIAFAPGVPGLGTLVSYAATCGDRTNTGSRSPITVTGLVNGTAYTCRVRATSTIGMGAWSPDSEPVTPNASGAGSLTVIKRGTGSGIVTSLAADIACGLDCTISYVAPTTAKLTAVADPGSVFIGWLDACIGATSCDVNVDTAVTVSATFAPDTILPRVDVDGNGTYDALTDGLLIVRFLRGLTGDALTDGATGPGQTRSTPEEVAQFLDNVRPLLDVDGDGQADTLRDGLMLIRYMFGLRGAAVTDGAIGPGSTRTPAEIATHLQAVMPE